MHKFPVALLCLTFSIPVFAQTQPITISVDLTDAPRKLLHAHLVFPVSPGPLTLLYPKWIPGEHSPTGPIDNLAGLVFTVNGQTVAWKRDDVNMYAFHLTVPAGASQLDAQLDFLATAAASGFSSGASTSATLCLLSWNSVVLYPEGTPVAQLKYRPSVTIPAEWKLGTALTPTSPSGATTHFEPVALDMLIDSPVLAGRYFREISLAPEITPHHFLDLAGDGPEDLEVKAEDLTSFHNLVREAGRLYASHHFRSYHFLVTLSDSVAHFGLEHHQSSDDRVDARTFLDDDLRMLSADLLPHEFTHSWNGKYRRPDGLATGNYSDPMRGDLLWIYEGLTQYLGDVLSARCGLLTPEQYRSSLAVTAASLDVRPGRLSRDLSDTAVAAQTLYDTPSAWDNLRRSVDYYPEGELIWLDADVTIRKLSKGKKSLNDFCSLFLGLGGDTGAKVVPYNLQDVVAALNTIQPYDWADFFQKRVSTVTTHAPLEGIREGGYALDYSPEPNEFERAEDSAQSVNAWYSLGFRTNKESVADVLVNSPAYTAGLGPGMKIVAVNGRAYSPSLLRSAIDDSKTKPVELILENTGFFRTVSIAYAGGQKHPCLKREKDTPDLLDEILKPLVPRKPKTERA